MRKSTRIGKRLIALFLVLLLSIESYAAIVGDNDGAAFITKAEFDSLKKNFQAQIDQYNTSIDNKIDGAIASYLSGVKIAKETILNPPVSNYDEIWWIQQFLVKGKRRKWTNRTTYTTDSTDKWQNWIAEKRRSTRENGLILFGGFGYWGIIPWEMSLAYQGNSSHWTYGHQLSQTTNPTGVNYVDYCVPVPYIRLQDKDDDLYLNNNDAGQHLNYEVSIENEGSWGHIYNDNVHAIYPPGSTSQQALWEIEGSAWAPTTDAVNGIEVFTPGADDFLKFSINTYRNNSRANTDMYKWVISIPKKEMVATYPHQTWRLNRSEYQNIKNLWKSEAGIYHVDYQNPAIYADDPNVSTDGISLLWMTTSNENNTNKYVNRMMYGWDQNTDDLDDKEDRTNVFRLNTNVKNGQNTKQIETFSDFETTEWKINWVAVRPRPAGTTWNLDDNKALAPTDKYIQLSLPLLENVKIKQIRNTRFKYNKNTTSLRLGDGMPLVIDCPGYGTVDITFDYAVNRIIDSVGSNKKIQLDVKKANFYDTVNTNNDDFYDGTINGTDKRLKAVEVDASDKKVKISIENVKKESDIWIRLAPKCNDGGYYVTLSNLKIKLIAE